MTTKEVYGMDRKDFFLSHETDVLIKALEIEIVALETNLHNITKDYRDSGKSSIELDYEAKLIKVINEKLASKRGRLKDYINYKNDEVLSV